MKLGDLEFKAADFQTVSMNESKSSVSQYPLSNVQAERISDEANRLLVERLEKAPRVTGYVHDDVYILMDSQQKTEPEGEIKQARLVCIEKIVNAPGRK